MINLQMKVGGYITSIKNMDTGEELIKEPNHNLVTNSGIDLLLNGRRVSDGTTPIDNYFMFTGNGGLGFAYPIFSVGRGTSPTTMTMTKLEKQDKERNGGTGIKGKETNRPHGIAPMPVCPFFGCIFLLSH